MPKKENIELTATEQGLPSADGHREWQYKSGSEWITLSDSDTLHYTLFHDAEIWQNRKTLTLRYIAHNSYYDIITISKIYDGQSGYSVQIFSSSGNNFINGDIATTLEARVFKGTTEITDTLLQSAFSWHRVSSDSDGDALWNGTHVGVGSALEIDSNDVHRKATFNCIVTINN